MFILRFLEKKIEVLSYIYQLRSLTYTDIYDFIFKRDELSEKYCHKIIREMVLEEVLEKVGYYKEKSYFFITAKGIRELKKCGYYSIGTNSKIALSETLSPKDLKMSPTKIDHQHSLNHFVLKYSKTHSFDYYDEKYVSRVISGCLPDGVIKEVSRILFLEMDMNTEREKALGKKWKNYRRFLDSQEYYDMEYPITVLFILGNGVDNSSKRATKLRKQIHEYLYDRISNNFNILIGTEEYLLNKIDNKDTTYIKETLLKQGYTVNKGVVSDDSLSGFSFDYYINMLSPESKLVTKGGYTEEYLIDDMTDCNIYSYCKLNSIDSLISKFKFNHNREIKYVAVMDSEEEAYRIFSEIDSPNPNIYFSTPSRLKNSSFHSALFQMSKDKRKWHFSEESLGVLIEEGKI